MEQAINAYQKITATDEFRHVDNSIANGCKNPIL